MSDTDAEFDTWLIHTSGATSIANWPLAKMAWRHQEDRIRELESLITDIHDKLYGEVMGWDDGSDEWEQMRQIAKSVHKRPSVSRKPNV